MDESPSSVFSVRAVFRPPSASQSPVERALELPYSEWDTLLQNYQDLLQWYRNLFRDDSADAALPPRDFRGRPADGAVPMFDELALEFSRERQAPFEPILDSRACFQRLLDCFQSGAVLIVQNRLDGASASGWDYDQSEQPLPVVANRFPDLSDLVRNLPPDTRMDSPETDGTSPVKSRSMSATSPLRPAAHQDRSEHQNRSTDHQDRGSSPPTPRSRPAMEAVQSKAYAPRSNAFTEERDQVLEQTLFHGKAHVHTGIHFHKYEHIPVKVSGGKIPSPLTSFEDSELHGHIKLNVKLAQYTQPTPVQKHGIPVVLAGRDLMACAQTGSGKTAAFLVPILSQCMTRNWVDVRQESRSFYSHAEPVVLIIAPTRELSGQIFDEVRKFAYRTGIRPCVVYGGAPARDQLADLSRGVHVLVCTPGRLKDFVERGRVSLAKVKFLVLDEADRMLDMGFDPQIRYLLHQTDMPNKQQRQTLMFSATFPRIIQQMASEFMRDGYAFLAVGRVGEACDNVQQIVMQVSARDKRKTLVELLLQGGRQRVLIFVQRKAEADMLDDFLFRQGFPTTSIHGDRTQMERESALESFKSGKTPILVATDVASRGLDIPKVRHVVIYDFPKSMDDYVHRIGRTARAGNPGKASSFFTPEDSSMARELVELLKNAKQEVPSFLLGESGGYGETGGYGMSGGYGAKEGGSTNGYDLDYRGRGGYGNSERGSRIISDARHGRY